MGGNGKSQFPDTGQATQACTPSLLKHLTAALHNFPVQKQAAHGWLPAPEPGGGRTVKAKEKGFGVHPVACSP